MLSVFALLCFGFNWLDSLCSLDRRRPTLAAAGSAAAALAVGAVAAGGSAADSSAAGSIVLGSSAAAAVPVGAVAVGQVAADLVAAGAVPAGVLPPDVGAAVVVPAGEMSAGEKVVVSAAAVAGVTAAAPLDAAGSSGSASLGKLVLRLGAIGSAWAWHGGINLTQFCLRAAIC